jgi:hypothetical protein
MADMGSNFVVADLQRAWKLVFDILKINVKTFALSRRQFNKYLTPGSTTGADTDDNRPASLLVKSASAPVTNTSGDEPTGIGDLCVTVNATTGAPIGLYICSAYTSSSVFDWTAIRLL